MTFRYIKKIIIIKKGFHFSNLNNETEIININPRRNFINLCFLEKWGFHKVLFILLMHHLKLGKGGSELHVQMERKLKSMMDFKKKMLVKQYQNGQ